eukprot:3432164-Alexandrium_andersonii.AAC.1
MERCAAPNGDFRAAPTALAVNLVALAALAVVEHSARELQLLPELLGLTIHDRPPLARLGIVRPRPPVE